jgi:hypothetical protein
MREIKFRAWDTKRKQMFFFEIEDTISIGYLKIMQFTGLQDKNGVDIYEGDKIELDNNWSFVIYSKVYCGFIFNSYMPQGLIHNLYKASNLGKVIGNIHE